VLEVLDAKLVSIGARWRNGSLQRCGLDSREVAHLVQVCFGSKICGIPVNLTFSQRRGVAWTPGRWSSPVTGIAHLGICSHSAEGRLGLQGGGPPVADTFMSFDSVTCLCMSIAFNLQRCGRKPGAVVLLVQAFFDPMCMHVSTFVIWNLPEEAAAWTSDSNMFLVNMLNLKQYSVVRFPKIVYWCDSPTAVFRSSEATRSWVFGKDPTSRSSFEFSTMSRKLVCRRCSRTQTLGGRCFETFTVAPELQIAPLCAVIYL